MPADGERRLPVSRPVNWPVLRIASAYVRRRHNAEKQKGKGNGPGRRARQRLPGTGPHVARIGRHACLRLHAGGIAPAVRGHRSSCGPDRSSCLPPAACGRDSPRRTGPPCVPRPGACGTSAPALASAPAPAPASAPAPAHRSRHQHKHIGSAHRYRKGGAWAQARAAWHLCARQSSEISRQASRSSATARSTAAIFFASRPSGCLPRR
jgi:hypothetical protein